MILNSESIIIISRKMIYIQGSQSAFIMNTPRTGITRTADIYWGGLNTQPWWLSEDQINDTH